MLERRKEQEVGVSHSGCALARRHCMNVFQFDFPKTTSQLHKGLLHYKYRLIKNKYELRPTESKIRILYLCYQSIINEFTIKFCICMLAVIETPHAEQHQYRCEFGNGFQSVSASTESLILENFNMSVFISDRIVY